MTSIPAGYRETELVDPFEIFVGPVYEAGEVPHRRFGLPADDRHVNLRGVVHGGMLMTLADLTLGAAVWDASDRAPCVTMNMQTQFLKEARAGDWIAVTPQITRRTRSLVFARADFEVENTVIFTAQSIWKLLGQPSDS